MKRTTKIVFAVAGLLGFASGGVLGGITAKELDTVIHFMRVSGARTQLSNFAARQFIFADDVHAREAALLQIGIQNQLEKADPENSGHFELATGYARLAMIEERAGNKEAEQQAFAQARYWYELGHPQRELTDSQIKDTVARMDKVLYKVRPE